MPRVEITMSLSSSSSSKAQALSKSKTTTVTLAILALVASLVCTGVGFKIFKGLGVESFLMAPAFTVSAPLILIFSIYQVRFALGPSESLRWTARVSYFLAILAVIGVVATLVGVFQFGLFAYPVILLPVPTFLVAFFQWAYYRAAYGQAEILSRDERSGASSAESQKKHM